MPHGSLMVYWARRMTWMRSAGLRPANCRNWPLKAPSDSSAVGSAACTTRRTPLATRNQPFRPSNLLNLNLLLIFIPVALIGKALRWSDLLVFAVSGLAIMPLSGMIGEATETLSEKFGQRIGGLINATLGNAAELIITIIALSAGLTELVKASIVGSILGNLLLVTGFSFLLGGLKHGLQTFERRAAAMNATLVILAFRARAIPSGFDEVLLNSGAGGPGRELFFSEGIALII